MGDDTGDVTGWPTMRTVYSRHLLRSCVAFGWNLTRVADALKLTSRTVYSHLIRLQGMGLVEHPAQGVWRLTAEGEREIAEQGVAEGESNGGAGDGRPATVPAV